METSTRIPFDDNPYVENVGTPQKAVLRFGIPVGEPGAAGTDGKSAYQIALDNGFVGTEVQWLESLKGKAGPAAATLPFSISKGGVHLETNAAGDPHMVTFSGFAPSYAGPTYIQDGAWASGTIVINESVHYPTAFIAASDITVKKIYVMFSIDGYASFDAGATIRPFVCLAVSDSDDRVYKILKSTITYTDPYMGGTHASHDTRRGALLTLNEEIKEGTLVGIVAGITSTGATTEQGSSFEISGGIYLE